MTLDSIFRIYSMTKPICSVAALMLVEDGVIQLADPIAKFLPAFKNMQVSVANQVACLSGACGLKLVRQSAIGTTLPMSSVQSHCRCVIAEPQVWSTAVMPTRGVYWTAMMVASAGFGSSSPCAAGSAPPLNTLPLNRNAFVRLHYVAVRQSEMLAWVMHDTTSSPAHRFLPTLPNGRSDAKTGRRRGVRVALNLVYVIIQKLFHRLSVG
jgi:hypothetical protein